VESLPERVERWRKAGLIDAAQAGRILEFEGRAPAERGGISVVEVIAYIGSLVVLAGLGFLYGSQFQLLGPSGRLTLVILVTVATLAIGLRIAAGQARPPLRRARAVALAVSVIAVDWLVIQLQYEQNPQVFSRDCCDAALQLFFNSSLAATLAAAIFLTWTGTGLLAFVFAVYADSSTGLFLSFQHGSPGWPAEVPWLVDVAVVLLAAERARSRRRRWAAEVLAYAASATLALSLISIGNASGRLEMELLGGVAGLAALAAAIWRSSPGLRDRRRLRRLRLRGRHRGPLLRQQPGLRGHPGHLGTGAAGDRIRPRPPPAPPADRPPAPCELDPRSTNVGAELQAPGPCVGAACDSTVIPIHSASTPASVL